MPYSDIRHSYAGSRAKSTGGTRARGRPTGADQVGVKAQKGDDHVAQGGHDGGMYPHQQQPPPPRPPTVYIEQRPDRAGTVALWLIILWIAAPVVLVVACCAGCAAFGGLGMIFGTVNPDPSITPSVVPSSVATG